MKIPSGPTAFRTNDPLGRGRAVFGGGYGPSSPYPNLKTLDMVNITTTGDAVDFGDLTVGRSATGMGGSATRGLLAGGRFPGPGNARKDIDYVTFSSSGGANEFGDLNNEVNSSAAFSDANIPMWINVSSNIANPQDFEFGPIGSNEPVTVTWTLYDGQDNKINETTEELVGGDSMDVQSTVSMPITIDWRVEITLNNDENVNAVTIFAVNYDHAEM